MTRRSLTQQDATTLVAALNRKINGWANYFWGRSVKPTEPWRNIRAGGFASGCVSNKERAGGTARFPLLALHQKFGLVRLTVRTASVHRLLISPLV
jgi:hypothetical protein